MRPIDADALWKAIGLGSSDWIKGCVLEWHFDDAPTLDVAPVVHGRWKDQDYTFTRFTCTACGSINHKECTNYCPNCGAKMDGEAE